MKILLTGAHGFIGGHLFVALIKQGHDLVCPVRTPRPGSALAGQASIVPGDFKAMTHQDDWLPLLEGVDCVINTVGIFQAAAIEDYERVHVQAPAALFAAARRRGIRVIQFSALGADSGARTDFHLSKRAADDVLREAGMPAFIVQPSLVYGKDGASARLFDRLAVLPALALPDGGTQAIQPVHVDDVVDGIVALLDAPTRGTRTVAFCGPRPIMLRDYLAALRTGLGMAGSQWIVAMPRAAARAAAWLAGASGSRLFNRDSLAMLARGNTADPAAFAHLLGRAPMPPRDFVRREDRAGARALAISQNITPVLRLSLALVWLWTAAVSFGLSPVHDSLALLLQAGMPAALAPAALYGAASLDLAFGILTLAWRGRRARLLWLAQACLVLVYMLIITIQLPEHWLHPFGPITKNLPILAVLGLLYLHDSRTGD